MTPAIEQESIRNERTETGSGDVESTPVSRALTMLVLVTVGEAIFILPFVIARVFRPALLDVFELTNLELGTAFSVYGVVAMLSYLPGGPIADRFSPGRMMAFALLATAAGGLMLATIPAVSELRIIYGYWGVTTILLFWAPLIRATRQWGGQIQSGRAFGILDGGRGLVAAVIGSLSVMIFASGLPADVNIATAEQRTTALQQVIVVFSTLTALAGVLIFLWLPRIQAADRHLATTRPRIGLWHVLTMPTVSFQALIVVCAYVGYKGLDDVSLYAHEALGMNEVDAAALSAQSMWVRPFAAITAGLLGDRAGVSRLTIASFLLLGGGSMVIAIGVLQPGMSTMIWLTVFATSAAVFALRGLYFAIMEEGRVPLGGTGAAVGIASMVGYTPDIFMGPLMGYLLDNFPGAQGHQYVFGTLAVFALAGVAATLLFRRFTRSHSRGLIAE